METTEIVQQFVVIGKVALAMLLAGLIGLERELKEHPAGLRTHMLVGGGAALFVILGELIILDQTQELASDVVEADPVRIIQAVVLGISFLGAGMIMQKRDEGDVKGLTTSASILFIAGIGVSVAIDQYVIAIGTTILTLIVLHAMQLLEKRLEF